MKKLTLLSTIVLLIFVLPLQSQSSKRIKRFAEKKVKFFLNNDVDKISSVTVVSSGNDPMGFGGNLTYSLASQGFRTLSQSVAKKKLLEIENKKSLNKQNITIEGPATTFNSDLVITFTYSYLSTAFGSELTSLNIQIIDLTKDGEIIGGARWRGMGGRGPVLLAESIAYLIKTRLVKKI